MNYTVYIHITPNNKYYVGITSKDVNIRWRNGSGYSNNSHFFNAINKYGWENIEHKIIAEQLTKEVACELEIKLIKKFHSNDRRFGYNNSMGGEINKGWKLTKEQRKNVSKGHKGIEFSDERKNSISNSLTGRKLSDAHRYNISQGHKGIKFTEEHKLNMGVKIKQFDKNNQLIKVWDKIKDAENELHISNIIAVCKGRRKTAGGFIWEYVNNEEVA